MYKLIRPLLFLVDPEAVHHLIFSFLRTVGKIPGVPALLKRLYDRNFPGLEKKVFGLRFPNPVGLAAGFDKDASLIDELACFGFGFIEVGTLTPQPQPGNPKPRLFRLPGDQAIINRMGFNNKGVTAAAAELKKRKSQVIIGGNIGKNKSTPNEKAIDDYLFSIEVLYPYVDYFVVNVSSPNTPDLRALQEKEPLRSLLTAVRAWLDAKPNAKPVLLKIAPDLSKQQLDDIVEILRETRMDGVVATNTTLSRDGLAISPDSATAIGAGGVSGKPLAKRATEVIAYLRNALGPSFPIIGVGGILSPDDALEKIRAGADLLQIYTGFIYEGPAFVKKINRAIRRGV
jgi:dihydroorotate dehydrogenase